MPVIRMTSLLVFRRSVALLLAASLAAPSIAATAQGTATPVPQANNAKDALLITSVEQAYAAGLAAYQAGKGDEARRDFDRAVDTLLQSGADIKNNTALSAELDRVVDSINTLQLDALKQGTPLTPKDDSPVDVANDVTFPVDPNVKAQAIAELRTTQSDLPLVINDYVASYINFFSTSGRGRGTIVASLQRAGKYKTMIQRVLKEEGVPQDLLYQAVAESGFRTQALNPKSGAAGMWQFMPFGTYGLEKTGWYDERFDPEKATRAYARDIKKTYSQLGDWYLAMAAYDWGTGNIQRAVQRTGYSDFWELYRRNNLPQETKNYVPIILAVAIMAKNPQQYGLDKVVPDAALEPESIHTNYSVSLQLVADITGASLSTINELNPSLLRGRTPPDEPYELNIPAGTTALYNQRIAEIPEDKRTSWRFHVLATGETLESVALSFHTTAAEIAFTNQLDASSSLAGVNALVIPVVSSSYASAATSLSLSASGGGASSTAHAATYRVRRGDTLVNISDQFGVSVDSLVRWNHLRGRSVQLGRTLYVAEPARISHSERVSRAAGRRGRSGSIVVARGGQRGAAARGAGKSASHAHAATKPRRRR
ncbi:lytic transglycosylase domain-containing protein [Acidipila sp. EB88]|uniref:lytic transglycosylase domain-containing protein n=1 Tax=Acidipila sp. EB88 TaxID=2305226 RepID=UPI00131517BA|nr:lytic transglycosylase domain-containing protein [Acidipila sp. EB88]